MDKARHHHRGRRAAVATLLGLGLALCMAACGDDEAPSAASEEEVTVALETHPAGPDTVAIAAGAERAAEDDGSVDLKIGTPEQYDPARAQRQTMDLLAQQPAAIGVAPFPPEVWGRTLQTVVAQVDHALSLYIKPVGLPDQADSAILQTFVGANDTASAREVMEATIEDARLDEDTTGTALIGQCVPGESGILFERTQGFTDAVERLLPRVEVEVFDSTPEPRTNTNAWESALQAHPDTVVAAGTCDQDGSSLYNVKRGMDGDFAVGAIEAPPEVIRGIRDGSINVAVDINHWMNGYVATRLLTAAARGEELPRGWVDTGFRLVDQSNVDEIEERDASEEGYVEYYKPRIDEFFADLDANVKPLTDAWE